MARTIFDRILSDLELERAAILTGSYETLSSIAAARDRFAAEADKLSKAEVGQVLERIEQNQRLLSSAIRGVHAAIDRIGDINRAHTRLGTYRQDGTRGEEAGKSGRLEHRA